MPPQHNHDTVYRPREKGVNLNTLVMSVGGFIIALLITVVGYFCKSELEGINTKLDGANAAQATVQTDVTTIKAQLPAINMRLDKVESSQTEMWRRIGVPVSGTKPTGDK